MITLNQISPELRVKVEPLFENCMRFDMSIDSILEGQTGGNIKIILDNAENPRVVQFLQGTFTSFAGDSSSQLARELITSLPPRCAIQPTNDEWVSLAKEIHGAKLGVAKRYSFSSEELKESQLINFINNSENKNIVKRIELSDAQEMISDSLNKFHFINYMSPEQFLKTGFGYCVKYDNQIVAACSTGLVSKKGVEICVITKPDYRRKGFASIAAAHLVLHCLKNGLEPHWDAANPMSCNLAENLGYKYIRSYEVYLIK